MPKQKSQSGPAGAVELTEQDLDEVHGGTVDPEDRYRVKVKVHSLDDKVEAGNTMASRGSALFLPEVDDEVIT